MFEGPMERNAANNQEFIQGEEVSIIVEGGDEVAGTVAHVESEEGGAVMYLILETVDGERAFLYQEGVWNEALAEAQEGEDDGEEGMPMVG